jgi:hypothetical protein
MFEAADLGSEKDVVWICIWSVAYSFCQKYPWQPTTNKIYIYSFKMGEHHKSGQI